MESNKEKVFLITGASTGIGLATARLAAEAGNRVVLTARSMEKLERIAAEPGSPERALAVACDVGDWDSVKALVEAALKASGASTSPSPTPAGPGAGSTSGGRTPRKSGGRC